jgi:basic membrane protein A
VLLAGCSLFSNQAGSTPPPAGGSSTAGTSISTETATPTLAPQLVKSITLVASLGEPVDWTPAGLTWKGIQAVGARVGASTSLLEPVSNADLPKDVDGAAGAPRTVVVTVGPAADAAVQAAAAVHPATQFFEMDVAVSESSPANVHGLAFDEAEAGYLGGYVAAGFAGSGGIGMVGDAKTDTRTANYAAGFASGAAQSKLGYPATVAYAGTSDSPDKGRTAAAGLVKAGDSVILAMPSLTGIGALREACARKARLVAVDTDAWQTVPDIQSCLIVSVMNRYDAAVAAPILAVASGHAVPRETVNNVANGGIALSEFHADLPGGFEAQLDAVVGTLQNGPPRPTPAPPTPAPSTGATTSPAGPSQASASPKPSGA